MLLQNLSKLLDDPRRRNIILVTLLLLLTMILVGGVRLLHHIRGKRLPGASKIESIHPIRSIPGGMQKQPTKAYTKLQMEQNRKIAEDAKKTGRSAIPTIVDSFNIEQPTSLLHQNKMQKGHYMQHASLMSDTERALAGHQVFMSQQQTELTKQQIQGAMHQQMNQLFNAWSRTPMQEYSVTTRTDTLTSSGAHRGAGKHVDALVKAGTILHAVLLTEVNSDEPSPVLAQITTDKFKDGRLMGTLSRIGERLLIQFHTLNLPQSAQTVSINALAVDEATSKSSLASDVDRHTLSRYGFLAAASFLRFSGTALQHTGHHLTYHPRSLDPTGQILSTVGDVGTHFSSELAQKVNQPPTVCVHAGTAIGILFVADLADPSLSNT